MYLLNRFISDKIWVVTCFFTYFDEIKAPKVIFQLIRITWSSRHLISLTSHSFWNRRRSYCTWFWICFELLRSLYRINLISKISSFNLKSFNIYFTLFFIFVIFMITRGSYVRIDSIHLSKLDYLIPESSSPTTRKMTTHFYISYRHSSIRYIYYGTNNLINDSLYIRLIIQRIIIVDFTTDHGRSGIRSWLTKTNQYQYQNQFAQDLFVTITVEFTDDKDNDLIHDIPIWQRKI